MKKFQRFDWVRNNDGSIKDLDTQINNWLDEHPSFEVVDYKFVNMVLEDGIPVEAALIEYEEKKHGAAHAEYLKLIKELERHNPLAFNVSQNFTGSKKTEVDLHVIFNTVGEKQ